MRSKAFYKKKSLKKYSYIEEELNKLSYKEAYLIDKRTYLQYYWSLLKSKHILIFVFYTSNDYNLKCSKIALLIILLGLILGVNAMFIDDKTMHKLYVDYGVFNLVNNIPQIIYSAIILIIFITLINNLALTQYNIIKLKKLNKIKLKKEFTKTSNHIRVKLSLLFYIGLSLLLFFWYFVSLFCIVYRNTQIIFLKNSLYSFIFLLIYPFCYYLLPTVFRILSLNDKRKKSKCLYQISRIIAWV